MKILFEASFEVCNFVGGIHTVVSTKVNSLKKYVDRHILLGPWFHDNQNEFIQANETEVPLDIQKVFDELSKKNISCTYGWWDISSKPEVVLIDASSLADESSRNYLKKKYWDLFKVDSLNSNWDFDEPLILSTAMGMFIEEFSENCCSFEDKVVSQFHEWMTGFAGLYLKARELEGNDISVKTVFTTHATMLGRALSGHNYDLNKLPKGFDPLEDARKIGVVEKYTAENACANFCDEFTTVSKITQKEAKLFFGRNPSLTYNGLNFEDFSKGKELFFEQVSVKKKIIAVLETLFPGENFDNHLLIFTSGRPEFHNKGHDSILQAMKKIQDLDLPVVCFFLVPWMHYGVKEKFDITTHHLDSEDCQPIVQFCKSIGINNKNNSKVVFYPSYVGSREDELFNMAYYELTKGFDLGIFASSYEPWGYTPMECLACGVPATTSDLTGFGDYFSGKSHDGLFVIKKDSKEITNIVNLIKKFSTYSSDKKLDFSLKALCVADKCSWDKFVKQYIKLYGF